MAQNFVPVDFLPDEMLLMIFSNLSVRDLELSASKVCRRWNCLISRIIARIQFPDDHLKIHGGLMALYVTKYIPSLRNSTILALPIRAMMNLKELTICIDYSLEIKDLKCIQTLKNLRHLDVFTTMNLEPSTPLPRNITSLVVNSNMAPGFLTSLSTGFKAFHMYGKAVYFPSIQLNKFLQKNSSYLTELTLRCSTLENKNDGLLDFIRNLPQQIEDLNLSYTCFSEEHCGPLAGRLPGLRRLELWRARVSSAALVRLVNALSALEVVDTDVGLTGDDVRALSGHQSLKSIRCSIGYGIREKRHKFCIRSASAHATMIRSDEEGPSAGLFYYWLRPPLRPPPGATPPCCYYIN